MVKKQIKKKMVKTKKSSSSNKSFWKTHSKLYLQSWKNFWSKKTLILTGIDVLLILGLLFIAFLSNFTEIALSNNLSSLVSEGQSLQQKGVNNDEIASILSDKYDVNIPWISTKIGISYVVFLILGVAFYALMKSWLWANLLKKSLKTSLKKMIWLNELVLVLATVIPMIISLKYPIIGAYLLLSLLGLAALILPLLYVNQFTSWKTFLKKLTIKKVLLYLMILLITLVTYYVGTLLISLILALLFKIPGIIMQWVTSTLVVLVLIIYPLIILNFSRYYLNNFNKTILVK